MRIRINIFRRIRPFLIIGICSIISTSCFTVNYSTKGVSRVTGTVSVQYFENMARTVEAGLSQQITDDLKDYLQSNTGLTLVNTTGEYNFEGSITTYEANKPVAITAGDEAAKNRFTIAIKVKFTCDTNPEMDFESSFSRYEDYSSDTDFENVKADLTKEILKLLIEDIFNRAFVNW
jgi:hypothetical protein